MTALLIGLVAVLVVGLADHVVSESMTAHLNRAATREPHVSEWATWTEAR